MSCVMDVLTTFGRKERTGPALHPGQRHSKAKELPRQGAVVKWESDKAAETEVKHLTKANYRPAFPSRHYSMPQQRIQSEPNLALKEPKQIQP
ncbi:hypothetical protein DV515_00013677 [Chloebia gouldiae]|uniref:Uncharacterized protein n=1 Tax=Chloebia gouldiae TaxID=44316 RepID=A0A3L8S0P5_CHLGU|nr:hypothetical protein DV515_00013677 [Chloebia gouldiae]